MKKKISVLSGCLLGVGALSVLSFSQAEDWAGKYVGTLSNGDPCRIEIVSSVELQDPTVKTNLGERFTNVKTTLTLIPSFASKQSHTVTSTFNTMWEAYDAGRLRGIDPVSGDDVWVYLVQNENEWTPTRVEFTAKKSADKFAEKQECTGLHRE